MSFYTSIQKLREQEQVILYKIDATISNEEEQVVQQFLKNEYKLEVLNYPYVAPPFDAIAALWAAKYIYYSCHALLQQDTSINTITVSHLEEVPFSLTPASILSVDLCLRFLPSLYIHGQTKEIDLQLLECFAQVLKKWHYSAIGFPLKWEGLDMAVMQFHPTVQQLYIDRIINRKVENLARHPAWINAIKASLGIHKKHYWNELLFA